MRVSRAGLVLHLTEHHGDCTPGTTTFVRMRGIEELHRELGAIASVSTRCCPPERSAIPRTPRAR